MTRYDLMKFRQKFEIGDIVVVPKEFMGWKDAWHREEKLGEVVGLYRNVFNVRYDEGFIQSFQYKDASFIHKLVENIA